MPKFHSLTIKKIIRETDSAVSILFDVPQHLQSNFQFTAGQYITVKKELNGLDVRRAYSICVSPNSNELKIAIKAVENGLFSVYATTQLQEGDVLQIAESEGFFVLEPQPNKNYLAFAAGSGITPIMSMVKTVLESNSNSITLVYGNRSVKDTIFKNELDLLKEKYQNRFNLHYVFSREKVDNFLFGRIDKSVVNYYFKNKYKNSSFDKVFICGPEELIKIVSDTLEENGMSFENIFYELFSSSEETENTSEIKSGETEITVLLDDEETSFTMLQTDTILAASLRNNLDAPYSCQGGVCSSCLGKITEGKAVMIKNTILTDDEVDDGFVLTCQAHPTTPKVVVDYDDV